MKKILLLIFFILLAGCGGTKKETIVWDSTAERGTFTDTRDGKKYKITKIGEQVWMAENLNYNVNGSKCYGEGGLVYNDESEITLSSSEIQANCEKYGRLYNWSTAMKACPKGWHLPSNAEWDKLYRYADGDKGTSSPYESKMAGKYLKATSGWNESGNGEDKFGFSASPGGHSDSGGNFGNVGYNGTWWSSLEYDSSYACYRDISNYYDGAYWNDFDKSNLYSVRCVRD
ncbi:MAG: fibrobacter succinogenes major paralogous domain-containing protein [Fibromonadaceae bacterium]|nr:fibrobacter succinogenes major paralogous domain-containing protein [Fibromonadaceae bacterium]